MSPDGELVALLPIGPAAVAATNLDALVLLLLGGLFALGMPRITVRGRRRFWHAWANSGLLPLLLGLAIGPTQLGWISDEASSALRPLLGLVLAAAGVLVGTQLRFAYLRSAGWSFLGRHSGSALVQFILVFVPLAVAASTALPWAMALGAAGLVSACAVASTQRPPLSTEDRLSPREVVLGHVVTCGWWNVLALVGGSLALSIGFQNREAMTEQVASTNGLLFGTPVVLGLVCGWLTLRAPNRDDLYLFLMAVLALSGGLALAVHAVPLFFGILVGVVLVNVASRRSTHLEGVLEELEQPLAMGTGLLAGLCLSSLVVDPWVWLLMPVLILGRWGVRGRLAPTSSAIGHRRERRFAPPGSAGILLIGATVLAPDPAPMLVVPLIAALTIATLISDLVERHSLLRGEVAK